MLGLPMGTIAQWGTFGALVVIIALLGVLLRHFPDLVRALNERARDRAAIRASATQEWQALETRVKKELDDCRREREQDAEQRQREREADARERQHLSEENFRMRVVLALFLDEFQRLDPDSDIVARAKVLLVVPSVGGGPVPNPNGDDLATLLDRLP